MTPKIVAAMFEHGVKHCCFVYDDNWRSSRRLFLHKIPIKSHSFHLENCHSILAKVKSIFMSSRCSHVTDIGVGYLSTMTSLTKLFLRWCTQVRDFGLQHMYSMRNLRVLSLAGTCMCPVSLGNHS